MGTPGMSVGTGCRPAWSPFQWRGKVRAVYPCRLSPAVQALSRSSWLPGLFELAFVSVLGPLVLRLPVQAEARWSSARPPGLVPVRGIGRRHAGQEEPGRRTGCRDGVTGQGPFQGLQVDNDRSRQQQHQQGRQHRDGRPPHLLERTLVRLHAVNGGQVGSILALSARAALASSYRVFRTATCSWDCCWTFCAASCMAWKTAGPGTPAVATS